MKLSQQDKELIIEYLGDYGASFDEYSLDISSIDPLLSHWSEQKQQLYKLLGNQVIVERPISIENDPVELMHHALTKYKSFSHLLTKFQETPLKTIKGKLENLLIDSLTLGKNSLYEDMEFETSDGKHIKAPKGSRPLRLIQRLSKLSGLEKEYESFQTAHSLALNQKKIEGTLCLSIHPMDFLTSSDNEEKWSSCVSVRRHGDYRAACIEGITSPMMVTAYVKSGRECEGWNSKRWRCFFIVNPMGIISIRPYPYMNSKLIDICGRWLEELAGKNCGWKYEVNRTTNWFTFDYDRNLVDIENTYVMFNQDCLGYPDEFIVESEHFGIFSKYLLTHEEYEFHHQGLPICPVCGELLEYTFQVACEECAPFPTCEKCGQPILHGHDVCWTDDDELYCRECYDNEIEIDSITGTITTDWVEIFLNVNNTLTKSCIIDKERYADKELMAQYFTVAPKVLDDEIYMPEYDIEHFNVTPLGFKLFGFESIVTAREFIASRLN